MDLLIQGTLNGLSYGMVLFLIGSGLSLIMGVMQILNLAHGAMFMVGGYVGWTIAVALGMDFWLAVLAAGGLVAVLGLLIERTILRRMHGRLDNQVLATLGITYILTNSVIWIWGAEPKVPFTPPVLGGSVDVLGVDYPLARIGVLVLGIAIAALLWWLQDKTRIGSMVRAGMDDPETASSLGVNVGVISAVMFTIGSFVAGISGVLGQQLTGLRPDQGMSILVLGLVVLVIGGIGTIQGALLGACLIGMINSFGQILFPEFAAFLVFGAMVLVLAVRPRGILGRSDAIRI
jgi:branched-chain amino acid transport system permease protein